MLVKIIKPCLTLEEIAQIILNANNKLINDMIEHTVMFGTSIGEITYDKHIADSVIFTPVHNYLKLDQSISAKNVDPIKIINAMKCERLSDKFIPKRNQTWYSEWQCKEF